jgi:hypothetical protein
MTPEQWKVMKYMRHPTAECIDDIISQAKETEWGEFWLDERNTGGCWEAGELMIILNNMELEGLGRIYNRRLKFRSVLAKIRERQSNLWEDWWMIHGEPYPY